MSRPLQRVVVLGAGTMGARLAAHCANHGLRVDLLDLTRTQAEAGLSTAQRSQPAAFFLPNWANRVHSGSLKDGRDAIGAADWVVEAIVEDLAAKRSLLEEIAPHLGDETILTTNTSGLPVGAVGAELPEAVKRRWFGTHFFNPPRYMRLVEVIPAPESDRDAMRWLSESLDRQLGKGVVAARDTPNFIANRIGIFVLLNTFHLMQELELTVEEVDALTGPLLGWPKSATFRTLDMIGLDTLVQVVRNSYENLCADERRERFQIPAFVQAMVNYSWLGEKAGQGFYKRDGNDVWALDVKTLTYHLRQKVKVPFEDLASAWQGSAFVRRSLEDLFTYAEARIGEITDDRAAVDQAMRWGYNWQYGPFELRQMLESGQTASRSLGSVVRGNSECSLVDLGDGIGCLEFHSKLNVIGVDTVAMIGQELTRGASPFEAFVISNGAEHFSAGADLLYLLAIIQNEDWDEIDEAVRRFQAMTMAVKRSPRPVVVAPFGLTLGGGCELMLHAARVVAHAELYTGLVEVGVGLIPAGGGTKEIALRSKPEAALQTIALAKISSSAAEARQQGLLRNGDEIIANRDRVLAAAKQLAQQLAAAGFEPIAPATLMAPGPSVESTLQLSVFLMHEAEQITDHEQKIANRLIHVLCAGGAPEGMAIPEQHLLDLEREAFLSLCGETKTQERIMHMLKTGKALRN